MPTDSKDPSDSQLSSLPSPVDDPAAPHAGEVSEAADLESAKILANLGRWGTADDERPPALIWQADRATMPLDPAVVEAFCNACITSQPRVRYGLGDKVPFYGAVPGKDFDRVDCSGFVREAIRRATDRQVKFPDGSVQQHDWVRKNGFARGTTADGSLVDGAVRIAFLRPQDGAKGIGHVALIRNGATMESRGGVGPDRVRWTGASWQAKAFVYLLRP